MGKVNAFQEHALISDIMLYLSRDSVPWLKDSYIILKCSKSLKYVPVRHGKIQISKLPENRFYIKKTTIQTI